MQRSLKVLQLSQSTVQKKTLVGGVMVTVRANQVFFTYIEAVSSGIGRTQRVQRKIINLQQADKICQLESSRVKFKLRWRNVLWIIIFIILRWSIYKRWKIPKIFSKWTNQIAQTSICQCGICSLRQWQVHLVHNHWDWLKDNKSIIQ